MTEVPRRARVRRERFEMQCTNGHEMKLSQKSWVERLSASGAEQDVALSDLRKILAQRLTVSLRSRPQVDAAFVEDMAQESLVTILGILNQFQGRSQFTTWATTIAVRKAFTELRRHRWKDVSLDDLLEEQGTSASVVDTGQGPDVATEKNVFVGAMYQVINEQLTEKQRTVLLAELEGMPQEEIGRRIGSNRNAIYKLAHDARKRLKEGLLEAGYSASDLASFQAGKR